MDKLKRFLCSVLLASVLISLVPDVSFAASITVACTITYYCPCRKCCGKWAGGPTASGAMPSAGRTVAHGSLPFGTKVRINGLVYTVEDRGVKGNKFDIFCTSHAEALKLGRQKGVLVEILPPGSPPPVIRRFGPEP